MTINNEMKSLREIFNEAMEARNLDVKKLAEMTDIPVHYLSALASGDPRKLPASPYVRGYLVKIADILKIDGESLLMAYKQEIALWPVKSSGPEDKLPPNRYALKNRRKIAFFSASAIIILGIISFFVFQLSGFLGNPKIDISYPQDKIEVNSPAITITGIINPQDKLTINGKEIIPQSNGEFEYKDFRLDPGTNSIRFQVKRFLGKEISVTRLVTYSPSAIPE